MSGPVLHRAIQVRHRAAETRASLEDDFHHFRVRFTHDGRKVLTIETSAIRQPYSLCRRAGEELKAVVGLALTPRALDLPERLDARHQCTHQFDLMAVAMAAAARGEAVTYRAVVNGDDASLAELSRNGERVLTWRVETYAIAEPALFEGVSLGAGFTAWTAARLDDATAEAALVLRRAVFISRGRRMQAELNLLGRARGSGGCWVQQPERAISAIRVSDDVREFTTGDVRPGDADGAWLAFETGD